MNLIWLLLACGLSEGELHSQKHWSVLGLNADGSLIDVRFSTGNSGMLMGQGHARADWIPMDEGAISYRRDALSDSTAVSPEGAQVGPDQLLQKEPNWELKIQSGELDSRLQITNHLLEAASSDWGDWTVQHHFAGEMQGVLRSGMQNTIVNGHVVGIYSSGSKPPGHNGKIRRAAFVLSDDIHIGVDQSGSHATAFAVIAGQQLNAQTARIEKTDQGMHLDFRPNADLEVWLKPQKPHLQSNPWEHLYALEKWIAGAVYGRPVRRVRSASAQVRLGERQLSANGLIAVNAFR